MTNKEEKFCYEYLKDLDGTKALIRAGYSSRHADSAASRLLKKSDIKLKISLLRQQYQDKTDITIKDILTRLWTLANVDIRRAFNEDGTLKDVHDIPDDVAKALSGIEVDELFEGKGKDREQIGVTRKIKFWDKAKALELLGDHLGMFTKKFDIDLNATLTPEMKAMSDEEAARIVLESVKHCKK